MIKKILYVLASTFLGMFGGQKEKGARRFGIPGLAMTVSIKNFTWRHLSLLLLIPILIMGYGQNSWLMSMVHNDTYVRILYGALLSFPFLFFGFRRWVVYAIILIVAFQVRAGSLGNFHGFDFLIEDLVRYGALSILLSTVIFKNRS